MKRRVVLSSINVDFRRYSLSVEFLAAKILADPQLRRKIRLIKKTYPYQTPRKKIFKQIVAQSPHLVGFSCYIWNITQILQLAKDIKNDSPKTLVVLGGPEMAGMAGNILKEHPFIDGVVMGEGEETFARMMAGWLENDKLAPVPGAAVRQEGRICTGPTRPLIDEMDKIPSPYQCLKPSSFRIPGMDANSTPPLQTLRGCNKGCLYCYYGKSFPSVRFFSLDRVNSDLEKIKEAGEKTVGLIDPNFFCNHDHAEGVIRLLSGKGLEFQVEANAEDMNEKVIDLLVASSCYQVNIGLQSANPAALKLCGRPYDMELFETNLRLLAQKAPDIAIELDLIYGLPGDTLEGFLNSLDFAFSLPADVVHFFRLLALHGTPFYEQPERWGIRFDPNPPRRVIKTCSFFYEDKNQVPLANCMTYWFSSTALMAVLRYFLNKSSDPPSQFFTLLIAGDRKRKKLIGTAEVNSRLKPSRLSDFRYILSLVKQIYPDVFPDRELEFIEEWFKLKRCLDKLEKKSYPKKSDREISKKEGTLWMRSNKHVTGRFRLSPRNNIKVLAPKPLQGKAEQYLIQRDPKGGIVCYEIPEEMETLLKFFGRAKTIESYLTAHVGVPLIKRHAFIMFARENGFIQPVARPPG